MIVNIEILSKRQQSKTEDINTLYIQNIEKVENKDGGIFHPNTKYVIRTLKESYEITESQYNSLIACLSQVAPKKLWYDAKPKKK